MQLKKAQDQFHHHRFYFHSGVICCQVLDCIFFCYLSGIFPFFSISTYYSSKPSSHWLLLHWCSCLQALLVLKCGSWACGTPNKPPRLLEIQHLECPPDLLNHGACSPPCRRASVHLIRSEYMLSQRVCILPLDCLLFLVALRPFFARGGREGKHGAVERH